MFKKVIRIYDRIEDLTLVTMFALMVVVIFYQVVMRYVFNNSSTWSEELGTFLFVWITWLGISLGARRVEHIKVMLVVDRMPFKLSQMFNILAEILVIVVSVITAYYAYFLVVNQSRVSFSAIGISMSWGYFAVALGCTLMCLRCLGAIYGHWCTLVAGPEAAALAKERQLEEGGEQ